MPGQIKIATVNTTDLVGILDVRAAYLRQAPIGNAWNEVRMGMFFTVVPAANDDTYCAAETIVCASFLDWFGFGLKESSQNAPGKAGAQFLGDLWTTNAVDSLVLTSNQAGAANLSTTNSKNYVAGANGATIMTGSAGSGQDLNFAQWAAGTVNSFRGLKFVVANPGLSNQTVTITCVTVTTPYADVSQYSLRNALFNTAYNGTARTINWFSGGAALPLPDYVWVRFPMNNNRLRITNLDCYKIS